ncbi:MAG: terminase [Burkholderiales bacterium]|nr:MAG: terminase [Burkholderiales bacterium]
MPSLNVPQAEFLTLPQPFRAMVCGFGTGKTWAGCASLCRHALEWPKVNSGYFAPTYPQIRDIFYPTIDEVAHDWGMRTKLNESNHEVHFYGNGRSRGTVLCRSMEKPQTIIGFKIGHAVADEIDVMEVAKATTAWRKIIARMRYNLPGLRNGVDVTTTPEGFKFVYAQFVEALRTKPELAEMYGLVQASTYDNEANLPPGYIERLLASYPGPLVQAYIRGQFVNLTSGSVYPEFDRKANHVDASERPQEALHVGMDFNVLNMTAVISVIRDGLPITVRELTKVRDTPTMTRMLYERYVAQGHPVMVYPDVSGQNTSSKSASESDFTILRQGRISINAGTPNADGRFAAGGVKDRINAVNAMIRNADGVRRWKINTHSCPDTTAAFEKQAYDKHGEPDKKSGFDHPTEALGYFMVRKWPIVRPAMSLRIGVATNG